MVVYWFGVRVEVLGVGIRRDLVVFVVFGEFLCLGWNFLVRGWFVVWYCLCLGGSGIW